ncbi:sensor histidine kinase [Methylobrevis pamukkalensis]|uniref:histidine kinase n=1 Tax=Methylobrevis pamukkalensis TaxID=1439726 RepID=A0A1E3H5D2_9HYPH|nr:HAMP domain-containing sensor histidine kinase [Methylobrevis pamukkalensis]ODN71548.1 Alginate biosynthesis sensor protein KinB [Methylobrevis pamukkalensis]
MTGFRDVLAARRWQITTAPNEGTTEQRRSAAAVVERMDQDLRYAMEEAYLLVSQALASEFFTLGADSDKLGAARILNLLTANFVRDIESLTARMRQETDRAMIFGFVETARERARTFCRRVETLADYCDAATSAAEEVDAVAVDGGEMIRALIEGFRPQAELYNVLLAVSVSPDAAMIRVKSARLRRIVTTVVENALQFNRDGGIVQVAMQRHGVGQVAIEITDSGLGMDDDEIRRIEKPFVFSGDDKEHYGLSLALAARLARLSGGRLEVKTQRGVGTRLHVLLPIAMADSRLGRVA